MLEMSSGWPNRLKTVRALNRSYIGLVSAAALPASDSMMPGSDRIGGDVVAPALERRRLRESDERGLGRRVARLAEATQGAGDRRHEDQAAPFVLDQVGPHLLRAVEGAGQVDPDVAVPQLVATGSGSAPRGRASPRC